ncbi:MAG: response regulator [Planctomycetes bacterium]|nr:response regulator [Planctomycetota bacterium]
MHKVESDAGFEVLPGKAIFSTGELAKICHVTKHTIISAIDKGDLRVSRTPGGHNRIRREDALSFMKKHNLLPENVGGIKILVVDDKSFVRDIMEQVFEGEGYSIIHACNGYEAGKLAERERPDLILLDILLPDIDGRDVCRHIREEKFGKDCRILAVTALKDPEEVEAIFAAGIDDYIAKPFSIEQLREKVEALLTI